MKLYTEEQVKRAISLTLDSPTHSNLVLDHLTPIELPNDPVKDTADYIDRHIVEAMVEVAKKHINFPSDEEIKEYSLHYATMQEDVSDRLGNYLVKSVHMDGAYWMKEQILNQNK